MWNFFGARLLDQFALTLDFTLRCLFKLFALMRKGLLYGDNPKFAATKSKKKKATLGTVSLPFLFIV